MRILAYRVAAILLLGVAIAVTVVGIVVNDRSLPKQADSHDGWLWMTIGLVLGVLATLLVCAVGPSGRDWKRVELRSVARSDALDFRQAGGFAVSVAGLAPFVLEIAAAATVLIYLLPEDQGTSSWDERKSYVALGLGLALGIATGAALAPIHAEIHAARRASRQRTDEIADRLDRLRVRLGDWCPDGQDPAMVAGSPAPDDPVGASWSMVRQAACRDARNAYRAVARELGSADDGGERTVRERGAAPWISSNDAVALISRLQGAEEALLYVAPANQFLAVWHPDDAWLAGSTNARWTDYLFLARRAFVMIDGHLAPPSPERPAGFRTPESDIQARIVLRTARRQMDEGLVARRTGLVRARTGICQVDLLTGLAAFGLVGAAVFAGATSPPVFATVGVLLVLWTVRIFNRLCLEALDAAQTEQDLATALVRLREQSLLWVLFICWTGLLVGFAASVLHDVSILAKASSYLVVLGIVFSIASSAVGLLEQLWIGSQGDEPDLDWARDWLRFLPRLASVAGIVGVIAFALLYAFLAEPNVIVLGR